MSRLAAVTTWRAHSDAIATSATETATCDAISNLRARHRDPALSAALAPPTRLASPEVSWSAGMSPNTTSASTVAAPPTTATGRSNVGATSTVTQAPSRTVRLEP